MSLEEIREFIDEWINENYQTVKFDAKILEIKHYQGIKQLISDMQNAEIFPSSYEIEVLQVLNDSDHNHKEIRILEDKKILFHYPIDDFINLYGEINRDEICEFFVKFEEVLSQEDDKKSEWVELGNGNPTDLNIGSGLVEAQSVNMKQREKIEQTVQESIEQEEIDFLDKFTQSIKSLKIERDQAIFDKRQLEEENRFLREENDRYKKWFSEFPNQRYD
ncbi:hypothetical protein [Thermoflavimicrobium daqui]|uniref:Uncharacterized protein n=1 Tax=Thermoflavimicrobium daqui TaxID=2137476 RepID=A0A364K0L4_9BACL|nr:hypothetical protein [Thermoflavimicrobium daqui]RAL21046.1 hypothetical protein DL897_17310 [Thermoflavimicrobium daqui]